jgi:H/ACA ribonucleoprotein complex subunit 3
MRIKYCPTCRQYTITSECKTCKGNTSPVGPARYSPKDPYGKYRRMMRERMKNG